MPLQYTAVKGQGQEGQSEAVALKVTGWKFSMNSAADLWPLPGVSHPASLLLLL